MTESNTPRSECLADSIPVWVWVVFWVVCSGTLCGHIGYDYGKANAEAWYRSQLIKAGRAKWTIDPVTGERSFTTIVHGTKAVEHGDN